MKIQNGKQEITLTFDKNALDVKELQRFIDYIKYREISSKSRATEADAEALSEEIKQKWWEQNKHRFEK